MKGYKFSQPQKYIKFSKFHILYLNNLSTTQNQSASYSPLHPFLATLDDLGSKKERAESLPLFLFFVH